MLLDVAAHRVHHCGLRVSVHRLRAAAQAGAIAGLLGLESMVEEAHVLEARALRGARWGAEDARARHAQNERAVEGGVAIEDGLPAAGVDPFVDLAVNLANDWFRGSGWSCLHCFL